MSKEYSREEIEKIWKRVKPTKTEQERLRIDRLESELQRVNSWLEVLRKQMDLANARLDRVESLGRVEEEGLEELVEIPEEEALTKIKDYVSKHPGCRTSEIIFNLNLDPDLVLNTLKKLEEKRKVRGEEIV